MNTIRVSEASDRSLLVSFGDYAGVLGLFHSLLEKPIRCVTNLHPAYCSLLIEFDSLVVSHHDLEEIVRERLTDCKQQVPEPRTITIPVSYGAEHGPDLAEVASLHQLSVERVIELHSTAIYTVYFLGFVPGFAYLGTLPEQLATPRLPTPRKQVPPGSVGIADRQTGVYPISTPGGWRLIGRTALTLFNPTRTGMSLLQPGDRVRFEPV